MNSLVRRHGVRAARWGLRLVVVAGCAVLVALAVHGVRLLPVLTGSMAPYASAGSLVVTVPVAGDQVAVGDVVAFRPPDPFEVVDGRPVLHRVAALDDVGGEVSMTTQGDANPAADPWRVATRGETFARTVLVVPHVGWVLAGGPAGGLAVVLGLVVSGGGVGRWRTWRRDGCADRSPDRRLDGCSYDVSVVVMVPAGDGPRPPRALARERALSALQATLADRGLVSLGDPQEVDGDGDSGDDSSRLRLTVRASRHSPRLHAVDSPARTVVPGGGIGRAASRPVPPSLVGIR